MEKELEVITIDNKDYAILKEKEYNDTTYIFLSNVANQDDIMIRESSEEDKDLFVPLENEKEFNIACLLLFKND